MAADGATVIAALGGSWIRGSLNTAPRAQPLPRPTGATGTPVRVDNIGTSLLLATWPKPQHGQQPTMLLDIRSGEPLVRTTLPPDVDITRSPVIRQVGGTLTAIGAVIVNTDLNKFEIFLPKYQVRALLPGHAIATADGRINDIALTKNNHFNITPYPRATTVVPFAAVKDTHGKTTLALALTPTTNGNQILLALPNRTK